MRGLGSILRRELAAYVDSPVGLVFLVVFGAVTCSLFSGSFFLAERADLRGLFNIFPQVMVIFVPAITMRLWAEEHRQGTGELLLTLPIPARSVVLGKFLAAAIFLALALATTLPAVVSVALLGDLDPGPVIGGYIGALVMGCFYLALGLFASGLVRDQVVAFILAFVLSFAFYLLGTEMIALQLDAWTGDLGSTLRRYLGLGSRFAAIERGVVDLRDILYFASGTGLFLLLNGLWIKVRLQPKARSSMVLSTVVLSVLWVLSTVVADPINMGRFDLTEDRLYTISPASKEMLRSLDAPLQATLYVSPRERMPVGMKTVRQDVTDLLEELRRASGDRFEFAVVVIDPAALRAEEEEDKKPAKIVAGGVEEEEELTEELSDEEELAERLLKEGVRPFEVRSVEADGFGVTLVYCALTLSYKDRPEQVVPRIKAELVPILEYELMMRVDRLMRLKKPKIALVAPVERQPVEPSLAKVYRDMGKPVPDRRIDHYSMLEKVLKRLEYQVHRLERFGEDRPLPDDADLIIVAGPSQWNERQLYELSAALRRGQAVLLATQRYSFDYRPYRGRFKVSAVPSGTTMDPFLDSVGVSLSPDWLFDRNSQAITMGGASMMAAKVQRPAPVEMDTHVLVGATGMNTEVPISRRLGQLLLMWASTLELEPEGAATGLEITPLLWSSEESWLVPAHPGNIVNNDVTPPASFGGPYTLAALVEGVFPSSYAAGQAPAWEPGVPAEALPEMDPAAPDVPATRLLVLGCDQMLRDRFITAADNGRFVLNAVDALALGDQLVNIRGKQRVDRHIERVSASRRTVHRLVVAGGLPLALALLGLARALAVQRRKDRYLARLQQGPGDGGAA